MREAAIEVLKFNLENLKSSVRWLRRSQEFCLEIGIKGIYSEEEFDDFENLTSRFARTTDLIVNKVLRSIDSVSFLRLVAQSTPQTARKNAASSIPFPVFATSRICGMR